MKKPSTLLKELKIELHYWQGIARQELRWAKQSQDRVRKIATKMRELQGKL